MNPNETEMRERGPDSSWFCDYCDKEMPEASGYLHANGIYYCSQECAEEKEANT